ncbi:uncharacterized protein B0H18DRAFT_953554 [Fomitopsis serialis]|uniref:uncharacterized protein n=1 Tax=Fomitopsis serialis TaxID=139415 RepID=UPI0020074D3D|nr:uncharacterized protein B0H18DRAFT_953554 [Neoantrodia serialis]KAH9929367.1 hypothetical protein B0H18DRAFT_953554 [Neoantrodia serialis]
MFHLAITGSETVDPVWIVGDTDSQYYCSNAIRQHCIDEGRISWRTCFREAAIPASYFHRLAELSYGPDTAAAGMPGSLRAAIQNWLLLEILGSIGGHTFL